MIKKCINILLIYFAFANIAYSQNTTTIKGLITSEKGETLPAANVYTKEFYYNTISDSTGRYKISIDKNDINDTLCFSFIGYETKKVAVKDLIVKSNVVLVGLKYDLPEIEVKEDFWLNVINKALDKHIFNAKTIPLEMSICFNLNDYKNNKIVGSAYFKADCYTSNHRINGLFTSELLTIKEMKIENKNFISIFPTINYTGIETNKLKSNHEIILDSVIKTDTNTIFCLTYFKRNFKKNKSNEYLPSELKELEATQIIHIFIDIKMNDVYYCSMIWYNKNREPQFKSLGMLYTKSEIFLTKINNLMVPSKAVWKTDWFSINNNNINLLGTEIIDISYSNIRIANEKLKRNYKSNFEDIDNKLWKLFKENNCTGN